MTIRRRPLSAGLRAAAAIMLAAGAAGAAPPPPLPPAIAYADLADLADLAPMVLRAQLRRLVRVEPARAPGVRPGWGRFYVEAKTGAMLAGDGVAMESLRYLVDLPLDARGKPVTAANQRLGKQAVLLFAAPVPGRPGELRLVASDAQVPWDAASEAMLRAILTELVAPDAPAKVTGVREAIHVAGGLAGEGETQMFLATSDGSAASIAVTRRTGSAPVWGVSFSEVAEGGTPPARETLRWYRLACFLPRVDPGGGEPVRKRRGEGDGRSRLPAGDGGAGTLPAVAAIAAAGVATTDAAGLSRRPRLGRAAERQAPCPNRVPPLPQGLPPCALPWPASARSAAASSG